ncbi:MAG TPA: anti-sigma factor [Candidatus Limnocylindrales bacterium]|nr:anti-sigma factor [Candidatus Limnocylindrales bacterium]
MTDPRRPAELSHDEAVDLAASFVLGALDEDEMAAVRAHLASCAEPHDEFVELGGVVSVLQVSLHPVEPPPALKDRIMAAAAADLEARRREATQTEAPAAPPIAAPDAPATTRPSGPVLMPRSPRLSWVLGLAAVLAIVALGGWNLSLQSQLGEARAYQQQVAAVLDAAAEPGALTAVMKSPTGAGATGLAAITPDGTMHIAMRDLAPTTGPEVYEAWAILPESAPVPLGGFQVGSNGVGYLESGGLPTQSGVVLALTREPGPGATAPSSDPVSVGTATSSG